VTAELSGTAFIVDRAEVVFTGSVPFLPPGCASRDEKAFDVANGLGDDVSIINTARRKSRYRSGEFPWHCSSTRNYYDAPCVWADPASTYGLMHVMSYNRGHSARRFPEVAV
jgi:hypothetical protein